MGQDVTNVHEPEVVPDARDQAVLVPADVEYGERFTPLACDPVRVRVRLPDVFQAVPLRSRNRLEPLPQRLLRIGVLVPELSQQLEADDAHIAILSIYQAKSSPVRHFVEEAS